MVQGTVEILPAGEGKWKPAVLNQVLHPGDRVRTGERSRAEVYLSGGMTIKKGELSELEIPPSKGTTFKKGIFEIFHRERDRNTEYALPGASAAIRGTDFLVRVGVDGESELTVLDGEVTLRSASGELTLGRRERGIVSSGGELRKTAVVEAQSDLLQWSLYYPGVVHLDDLAFTPAEASGLARSFAAYRGGDLPGAVAACPWDESPASDAGKVYRAALLLSCGEVAKAEGMLGGAAESEPSRALKLLVGVIKGERPEPPAQADSASEWLAKSYAEQASGDLNKALNSAWIAAAKGSNFGFAWERVAELEFSFGNIQGARAPLGRALALSPRNAQALALRGFLAAAENRIPAALDWFEQAMAADSALGNAWLGRGLCRIRQGHAHEGLEDLMVAASLEPQRSLLRSYLGKAFANAGDDAHALKELRLARELDPNDPTAWLYGALLAQQENRVNQAALDLAAAQARNDNRSLFRSRLLLDEDRAVGSANLASIYRDLDMREVSVREASQAATFDFANPSAHLFLSDAYDELRDPTRFNLRYEAVWFNELLLANILAPVGGGRLAQQVAQQDYSKLFQADGPGFASSAEGRSDGQWRERASQYGTFGGSSYALDLDYQHHEGIRVNNRLDDLEWTSSFKQQLTPEDSVLCLVQYENYHSGDNFQYYDVRQARPNFQFYENESPNVLAAWHHEWAPGMHTMALVGRLVNEQELSDRGTPQLMLFEDSLGNITPATISGWDVRYHNQIEIYSGELNQIAEWERLTLTVGSRFQSGSSRTHDQYNAPSSLLLPPPPLVDAVYDDSTDNGFDRVAGYGYATFQPVDHLWLTGGAVYDDVRYPANFRNPPVQSGDKEATQFAPKAALVWNPIAPATLRGDFTRSLGGVSIDQDYRLEPSQLAGFPQTFRSLISESVVGSVVAPEYETAGLALDLKFGPRTFAGVEVQKLDTDIERSVGAFRFPLGTFPAVVSSTPERLHYEEQTLTLSVNRMLGQQFSAGASYQLTDARLHDRQPELAISSSEHSRLHQVRGYLLFNDASGFFAEAETLWYGQENAGFASPEPGDAVFQQNFYVGYRFAHRRAEVRLGVLNANGCDYKLEPLTLYQELPRGPVFDARLNIIF